MVRRGRTTEGVHSSLEKIDARRSLVCFSVQPGQGPIVHAGSVASISILRLHVHARAYSSFNKIRRKKGYRLHLSIHILGICYELVLEVFWCTFSVS